MGRTFLEAGGVIFLIVSSTYEHGAEVSRRRGLDIGTECMIVWDIDSLHRTCLADWEEGWIEADPLGFSNDFKREVARYVESIYRDPAKGFGLRNLLDKPKELW